MKKNYLVVYDYKSGGVWAIIAARSEAEIQQKYPMLAVVKNRPGWMTDVEYQRLIADQSYDIDDPPSGWLATMLNE